MNTYHPPVKPLTRKSRAKRTKVVEYCANRAKAARKASEFHEKCMNFAQKAKNSGISIQKAAQSCGISHRQMVRFMRLVSKTPHGLAYV